MIFIFDSLQLTFSDFVKKYYNQRELSVSRRWDEECDVVLRYEGLPDNFFVFLEEQGITRHNGLDHINVGDERKHCYQQYYTPAAKSIIEGAYERDFKRFDYKF